MDRRLHRDLRRRGQALPGQRAGHRLSPPEQPPDALILETELSVVSGFDLIAQARGLGPGPIIIVLSHQDSDEHIRACLRAGADDVMTKPFSNSEILEHVRALAGP